MKRGVLIVLFILLSSSVLGLTGDFDGNLCVNLEDFFLFADQYEKDVNSSNEKFDLDGKGTIDIEDFFIFADGFEKCEDLVFNNLHDGDLINTKDFVLELGTREQSECFYKLFREITATSEFSGKGFRTENGLVHYADLREMVNGNYNLLAQCRDAQDDIKEKSLSFTVNLLGANAEISVATTQDQYWNDEDIQLTDPPSQEKPLEKITGQIVQRDPTSILNDETNKELDIEENEKIESNGYIVEFDDEPILVKKINLENKAKENQKYIDTHAPYNPNVLAKRAFGVFSEDVDDEVERYRDRLNSKNAEIKGRILGKLNKKNYATKVAVTLTEEDVRVFHEYKNVFNGIALDISEEEAEELRSVSGVKEIHPNYPVEALLQDSVPLVNADDVWKLKDNKGEFLTGKGVDIAVIDTGVDYTHPDLGACSRDQFLNGNCRKVVGGYDFYDDDPDPMDCDGHGTHVAATAAGNGALKGVAPDANIYAYRVLDCGGSGDSATVVAAIEKAVDPNGDKDYSDRMDIISMSLGCTLFECSDDPEEAKIQAVNNAVNAGVTAVISAGNSGRRGAMTIGSPGAARNAITVGAVDKQLKIAAFSSKGPTLDLDRVTKINKPDIVAPGVSICAAGSNEHDDCNKDDKHFALSGTSMSTPHVSGAAAILIQKNPSWTSFEIKEALKNTATDLGLDINTQGAGFLDVLRAVSLEKPPAVIIIDSVNRDRENVTVTGTITHTDFYRYEIYIKQDAEQDGGNYNKIYESFDQVSNGIIVTFSHVSLDIGKYELELKVYDKTGGLIGNKIVLFNVPNVEVLEVVNDEGIDKDNDGSYDALAVELEVYARNDGPSMIEADLVVRNGERSVVPLNVEVTSSHSVVKENNTLKFEFDGSKIRRELINNLGFDFKDKTEFKLNVVSLDDERRFKSFDLINKYGIDDFDKIVDLGALDIRLRDRRAFSDSKNRMKGEIKNNGNTPVVGKVSVYEIKSEGNDLIYYTQLFEEMFDENYYFDFDYIPDKDGLHKLRFIVEAEEDINVDNNMKETEIFVYPKKPDITGEFLFTDSLLIYNETNEISVEIMNVGKTKAKDANVSLFFINPEKAKDQVLIERKTIDVDVEEVKKMRFKWIPQIKGDVILRLEIEAEGDIDLENNIREKNVVVVANAPDINIDYIDIKKRLLVSEETKILVFLKNIGPRDAENVSLIVSGEGNGEVFEINRGYIERINSGSNIEHIVKWVPGKLGEYMIKAIVEVEGDENLDNNEYRTIVKVLADAPDVIGDFQWKEIRPIINQPYDLEFVIRNQGFKAAGKISVSLFKSEEKDKLIGSKIIDSLSPDEEKHISFEWTPENFGWVNLKLVIESENDADIDNNLNEFGLRVLNDKPDIRIQSFFSRDNFVVNKENTLEFNLGNEGGRNSNEVFVLLYHVDEISGEETLLDNRSVGIIEAGGDTFLRLNPYVPKEIGIKKFRLKAIVEDDYDLSNNEADFVIKIIPQSRLTNRGDDTLSGHLLLELQKENNGKWESYAVLIDDQKNDVMRMLDKGESLALDKLYNELETRPSIKDKGRFRIYTALFDENRNVIETFDQKKLEASYQFTMN